MIPDDKTAAILKKSNSEEDSSVSTFSSVVDKAFDELKEKQMQHSIRRIQEMEESLFALERELDAFIAMKSDK